jgi:heterodisulfide reductase subunit A
MPTSHSGSVLVVGGGIAGMQASLDLAAQLDKTFPTNDCAM